MKIVSYNVNGIRAAITKGLIDWLAQSNADIVCFQEIKATEDQIPTDLFHTIGYKYCYFFPAQKKGYSGVGIISKIQPKNIVKRTGIAHMDDEGRNIRADFTGFSVMSLYLPSGTNTDRLDHKFEYMRLFQNYITELQNEIPNLIIGGDYNICHQAIDIHDPIRNATVSGFLPEERAWLDGFLKTGFIDTFRHFVKDPHNYSWWSYRANARNNNKGWRIDYLLATKSLENKLVDAQIHPDAVHSDHCPVSLQISN